jgi:hypothetical protein
MPKIAVLGLLIELTSGLTFASDAVQVSSPFGDINP